MNGGESLSDELKKHRDLALERARMEADFEVKLSALKKIKSALSKTPDLDIDKVQHFDRERKKRVGDRWIFIPFILKIISHHF